MQIPNKGASHLQRVRYGDFVAGMVEDDENPNIAALLAVVEGANEAVLAKGNAWEQSRRNVTRAVARRKKARARLFRVVQVTRKKLEGADLDGADKPEYKLVFAEGIDYWRACPFDEVRERFNDFRARIVEHLAEDHPVRVGAVPMTDAALASWTTHERALEDTRGARRRARTALDKQQEAWAEVMQKEVLGTLIKELGANEADSYFQSASDKADDESPADERLDGDAPVA